MNLIILTETERVDENRYRLDDKRADHIRSVLRLSTGDTVEVGLLNGPAGYGIVESVSDSAVNLACRELKQLPDPFPVVDLICALPRPQTLKKVLLTCGMMGVRRLFLIRANRVEKSYYQSPLLQPENYRPYLIEGLSQGKQTRQPDVFVHNRFKPFFEDFLASREDQETDRAVKLLPDRESSVHLDTLLRDTVEQVIVAVGPEGGWVDFEIDLMEKHGFRRFCLGPWVLRVETAVAAALAQVELLVGSSHTHR